ncbi:RHTO0S33e00188g1_1 [Rhodotorula toruloides]|uniref:RHTO0S33e00188g1_1 n=1 Tax=Rhodotorula toruloides TaxID=5286 RepID=A0A061BK49_RHOTO|nr:RHTO0S33e00188g1_1 [Rhodotorula toruloides]
MTFLLCSPGHTEVRGPSEKREREGTASSAPPVDPSLNVRLIIHPAALPTGAKSHPQRTKVATRSGPRSLVFVEPVLSDKSSPLPLFFLRTTSGTLATTRASPRRYGIPTVNPSVYPDERRRHRPPPPSPNSDSPSADDLSSASEHGSPPPLRYSRTPRMAPASTVVAAPAYQPGKAPYLLDDSPAGLASFSRAARLFFHAKSVKDNALKVAYVGGGLVGFPELYNWYLSSATEHEAKTYDSFWADLLKRALPRDYVWDAKGRIRWAKQGDEDYEVWSSSLRTEHLQLTDKVMSTRDFIECLLYGMDPELSTILRRGSFLRNSGFHEDDLSLVALSTSTLVFTAPLNYEKFDRSARDEWNKIAARRRSNAAQIRSLSRKTAAITVSKPSRSNGSTNSGSGATTRSNSSSAAPQTTSGGGGRPPKLTEREKDWLSANNGCFRCRRINISADHDPKQCTDWAPANYVIKIPQGWEKNKPIPASVPSSTNASISTGSSTVELAAIYQEDDEVDLPESLADDSDTDGDKLAAGLGLERFLLSRPERVRFAIQGEGDLYTITHFVRCGVALENGTWSAGTTTLLVAPLEEPFGVILGVPFLKRHRLSLTAHPEPAILVDRGKGKTPYNLLAPAYGPATAFQTLASVEGEEKAAFISKVAEACAFGLVDQAQALTEEEAEMKERSGRLMEEFADLFPSTLPPLTADYLAKTSTRHRIRLVDEKRVHNQRGFAIPRKWRESWKRMLEEHLAAGRLRPSTSPYASAAFVVPKKDLTVDPRWVNDYRALNSNTVKDRTPLPIPDQVLADAALAKYWGKTDMTNAFFQTPMAEEDIAKTAIKTPWGLFEWTVMPQGLCNAPATHQARVNKALRHLIGVCCQAFVDDVIIYSRTVEEHEENCRAVLEALRAAGLYCSMKKTDLFTLHTEFLGHVISREGIQADPSKTEKIKSWPRLRTVTQVRGFLGLVQYLRKFIPLLAEHTAVLTPLTKKGLTDISSLWGQKEEVAFEAIKRIVTLLPVLRALDQDSDEPIWLMTDASKVGLGAVLLQVEDWKTARPCGFYSRQYIPAERNYPTHEQELLAVVAALKAWRVELLGVQFRVLTDHDTLRHFRTQATLLKQQARWTETLADYDYELSYIPGKANAVADSLSRFSFPEPRAAIAVCGISEHSISEAVVEKIKEGYLADDFCVQVVERRLVRNLGSSSEFERRDGLIYYKGDRILVPDVKELREALLHDAHDALGHMGVQKTLRSLSLSFFWPRMTKSVVDYVRSCDGCQRNKSRTNKVAGKLHSLPVPVRPFSDVALDFVGPLPSSEGRDMLLTVTDRLTGYTRLFPCRAKDEVKDIAEVVFKGWFSLFGLPERMVSDRDKLFTSRFWRTLHSRLGLKSQMSTSFHPETDGRSERMNKTVVQVLRQQTPFELVLGFTPSLSPRLSTPSNLPAVNSLLDERNMKINEARDALAVSKVRQAEQANKRRSDEETFAKGDLVLVDSRDRRMRYKSKHGHGRAAKLFPRWDGPFEVVEVFPDTSTYRLQLTHDDKSHPVFHISKLKRYNLNNADNFPSREPPRPGPIDVDGEEEYEVEAIVDEKGKGRGLRYLVKWRGYPDTDNGWEPLENVKDTEALKRWKERGR